MTPPLLRASGLIVRRGAIEVLHGVDLAVQAQEIGAIIGPNGAGKSTLLGALAGLYPVRAGEVWFDDRALRAAQAEARVGLGISLVPERRQIFARLTVRENLLLGAYLRYRRERRAVRDDLERTHRIFPRLAALDRRLGGALSGGEQQMLAIGRALMSRPRVLLLDEPSLGLAPIVVREIMTALTRLRREEGMTVVLVEQNVKAALGAADRASVLERGRIVLQGASDALLAHPGIRSAYLGKGFEIAG